MKQLAQDWRLTPKMVLEIIAHEGVVLSAYKDSVGVWTWGLGVTRFSGHNPKRYKNNPATLEKTMNVGVWLLEKYAKEVREVFHGYEMTEHEFAAALSFQWNTGKIHKASWVHYWKRGMKTATRERFLRYNKPPEIRKRRKAEVDLLLKGKWVHNPNGYIRVWPVTRSYRPNWKRPQRAYVADLIPTAIAMAYGDEPAEAPEKDRDVPDVAPKRTSWFPKRGFIVEALWAR